MQPHTQSQFKSLRIISSQEVPSGELETWRHPALLESGPEIPMSKDAGQRAKRPWDRLLSTTKEEGRSEGWAAYH